MALVPARGGSKGIPGKNIRSFAGKPLLYWVCRAAEDCAAIDATYVSTDDPAIADTARALGLSKVRVVERAPDTATDTASTESAMLDFADRVEFDRIALLQATSPLLTAADLDAGLAHLDAGFDSALSVVRQRRFRWRRDGGAGAPENYDPLARPRRQDFDGFLVENGAFYATSRAILLRDRCRLGGRVALVEMPEESYFELDDETDWRILEGLFARRRRGGALADRLARIRLVATDVDGCLTDSGMYYGPDGEALKKFSTRDGKGFDLLHRAGFQTAIITAESTASAVRRAEKLRVPEAHIGIQDKVACMEEIRARLGLAWEEIAYLGDDLGDLDLLRAAGVAACPADAVGAVADACDIRLRARGGSGAFREFADMVIAAAGRP